MRWYGMDIPCAMRYDMKGYEYERIKKLNRATKVMTVMIGFLYLSFDFPCILVPIIQFFSLLGG